MTEVLLRRAVWLAGAHVRGSASSGYLAHGARTPEGQMVSLAVHGVGLHELTAGDVLVQLERALGGE